MQDVMLTLPRLAAGVTVVPVGLTSPVPFLHETAFAVTLIFPPLPNPPVATKSPVAQSCALVRLTSNVDWIVIFPPSPPAPVEVARIAFKANKTLPERDLIVTMPPS